jgi:histidinol dehydrogenase
MKTIKYPDRAEWKELLKRPTLNVDALESMVSSVLNDIKVNGDVAVKKYTLQFDKVAIEDLLVTEKEFSEAEKNVSE